MLSKNVQKSDQYLHYMVVWESEKNLLCGTVFNCQSRHPNCLFIHLFGKAFNHKLKKTNIKELTKSHKESTLYTIIRIVQLLSILPRKSFCHKTFFSQCFAVLQ